MSLREQASALDAATLLTQIAPQYDKELRTQLVSLPTRLHRSGLAATTAFVAASTTKAKLGPTYLKVEALIVARIKVTGIPGGSAIEKLNPSAFRWLGNLSAGDYARLNAEIADVFGWLKRLSEAARPAANGNA